jgi:hypothetical protein
MALAGPVLATAAANGWRHDIPTLFVTLLFGGGLWSVYAWEGFFKPRITRRKVARVLEAELVLNAERLGAHRDHDACGGTLLTSTLLSTRGLAMVGGDLGALAPLLIHDLLRVYHLFAEFDAALASYAALTDRRDEASGAQRDVFESRLRVERRRFAETLAAAYQQAVQVARSLESITGSTVGQLMASSSPTVPAARSDGGSA